MTTYFQPGVENTTGKLYILRMVHNVYDDKNRTYQLRFHLPTWGGVTMITLSTWRLTTLIKSVSAGPRLLVVIRRLVVGATKIKPMSIKCVYRCSSISLICRFPISRSLGHLTLVTYSVWVRILLPYLLIFFSHWCLKKPFQTEGLKIRNKNNNKKIISQVFRRALGSQARSLVTDGHMDGRADNSNMYRTLKYLTRAKRVCIALEGWGRCGGAHAERARSICIHLIEWWRQWWA